MPFGVMFVNLSVLKRTLMLKQSFMCLLLCLVPVAEAESQVIYRNRAYQWKGNAIMQKPYTGKALDATHVVSDYKPLPPRMEVWNDMNPKEVNRREWKLGADIAHLPEYCSDNVLDNALYNMALEESVLAIEPDSTFRTGIAWGGVWTRDVSYSIILSLAQLHPEVAKKSLRAKVTPNNRIIQDTGTGGAWPCSTDRTIWAVAAWEVYKVTGDRKWLDYIYPIISNTLTDDMVVAYDRENNLMRGETSYMDWREQEYPQWMEPADIYSSEATVNNAVHYMAIKALAEICEAKGLEDEKAWWGNYAEAIRSGINDKLWLSDKGYYAIYLYGRRYPIVSKQCDAMGNALCILSGVADEARAKAVSSHVVSEPFGTPCIYPNLKDQYPYHNDATWPFVQGYWMKACAMAGNEEGVVHSIGALYRGAALWLSNEENYEITTGDYQQTKLNSPRQLWSVAAQVAVVPHVYFGICYEADRMTFCPFVPKVLKGDRVLKNFRYRNAVLDMKIHGHGNRIDRFMIDGQPSEAVVDGNLTGRHTIDITLSGNTLEKVGFTMLDNAYLPVTPELKRKGSNLTWDATEGSVRYQVLRNGKVVHTTEDRVYTMETAGEYAVRGVAQDGTEGYISEPTDFYEPIIIQAENYGDPDGDYLDVTRNKNIAVTIPVDIREEGDYSIDWRYSNGAGPVNTSNKCATRLMKVDRRQMAVVFPQRGSDEWDNWGFSNKHTVRLTAGRHMIGLYFTDRTENMNLDFNCAHVDCLRLTKLTE